MKPMTSVIAIAKTAGRDYITPEDIRDAVKNGADPDYLRREVLMVLGGVTAMGVEDSSLCAHVAYKARKQNRKAGEQ